MTAQACLVCPKQNRAGNLLIVFCLLFSKVTTFNRCFFWAPTPEGRKGGWLEMFYLMSFFFVTSTNNTTPRQREGCEGAGRTRGRGGPLVGGNVGVVLELPHPRLGLFALLTAALLRRQLWLALLGTQGEMESGVTG